MPVNNSYESVISAKSPKIWFKFNETAGTPVNSGSLSCTLTATGTPTLNNESGVDGRSVYFAANSYYTLSDFPAFSLFDDRSFTVEGWFKTSGATVAEATIFSYGDATSTNSSLRIFIAGPGNTTGYNQELVAIYRSSTNQFESAAFRTPALQVNDNKWHHFAVTVNTTSLKLYLDGVLLRDRTITTSANAAGDAVGTKNIAAKWDGSGKFFGQLDEIAIYERELTSTEIIQNYNAGANVSFTDIAGTASALMVLPTETTQIAYDAAVMTASALAGDTEVANFDKKVMLPSYLSTLSLEQNIELDYEKMGPGGAQALGFIANQAAAAYTENYVTPSQDGSWSCGIWVKAPTTVANNKVRLWRTNATTGTGLAFISINNGNPAFTVRTTSGENEYNYTSLDIRDNTWHYLAMRVDGTTVYYYVDGTQIYTTNLSGSRAPENIFSYLFGVRGTTDSTDTSTILISSFYMAPYNTVGATEIGNIWTAGNNNETQAAGKILTPVISFDNQFNYNVEATGAEIDLRFNGTGTLFNSGTEGTAATVSEFLTAQTTKGILTKNTQGYYFEDAYDWIDVVPYQYNDWNGTNTHSIYAKFEAPNESITHNGTNTAFISGLDAGGDSFGAIVVGWTPTGVFLGKVEGDKNDPSQWNKITVTDTSLLGSYHLYTIVEDGDEVRGYIDGKLVGTLTEQPQFPNYNTLTLNYTGFYGNANAGPGWVADELQIWDYPLTEQQIFEMWQSIDIYAASAESEFVMPTNIAGTGSTQDVDEMIITTSTLPMPAFEMQTNELADPIAVFAEFLHPNYGANVNIDVNYGHSAFIASALSPMPQANIGDSHIAVPMNASALMGEVVVVLPGQIQVSPMVASSGELVMPGIVTIKGARIFAETLNVRAIFPLPPAYEQLTDDNYYVRLYAEHSQKTTEAAQTFAAAGIATTGFTAVAKSFLKFFNDVTQDITVGSSRFLINEMPDYVYDEIGTVYTDNNGNTVAPPTTKKSIVSSAPRGSLTPTPIVSQGYFDAWDRKAVNFTNIEFNFGTDSQNHSQRQYSVEFTIKTTKSNQVMTYGNWASFYNYQRSIGTIGLFNGKLYSMESAQNIGKADVIPHPANLDALSKAGLNTGYMLGNKRIDDGQWHHVVIQYGWTDGRTQYWIDGELDRQMIGTGSTPGSNGKNGIRPFIVGFNSNDTNLSSDFQTSVWSWTPNKFLLEQDITINYEAAYKYSPIFVEPMLANVTATPDNQAAGNRGRALMLYFWPTNTAQRGGNYSPTFDAGTFGGFDVPTFDPLLDTVDYIKNPPQEYEGWDVFPVDVAGYFVSDLVKVEAYGGRENILLGDGGGAVLTTGDANRAQWKFNSRGTFRDALTDAPRYIDLVNDIDLTQFDAIFFKNFPDQSNEIDRFAKDEVVDSYFSIRELKIYEDFIKSVRAAVDSGLSLYVTNTELAIDLGIIDRVEIVSDMDDIVGYESDVYAPTHPYNISRAGYPISDGTTVNVWKDTYKNNRFRLVNEVPGMTDFPTVILTDRLYWSNDDQIKWGGADTNLVRLVIKPNGLAVGDEWIESTYNPQYGAKFYEAVPFANIKAGKPVVAFANEVRRDLDLIDNPYKNYATVIVVEPGNPLNGSLCGGKIYVNFTERLKDSVEDVGVDLIQDTWINYAESEGLLTAEEAADFRTKTYNIDRQLAAGTITQSAYDQKAYWSSNSDYILQQNTEIGDASDTPGKGGIAKPKSQQVRKINKNGGLSFTSANKGSQWFSIAFSYLYPRITLDVPSMLTRGFWWVSNKEQPEGTVVRVLAMTASATSGQAIAVPDKIISASAQAMVASAKITETFGYTPNSINNVSLPMQASALMTDKVFKVDAEPMRVTAAMTQLNRALTSSLDEVIVYIMHEDPILYLREEVIK